MKKCLLIAFALFNPGWIFSQCNPSNNTVPGAIPSITDNLPIAYAGNNYSSILQLRTPDDTTVNGTYATLTELKITGISNLPPGFAYTCNPSNCTLGPLSNGCMNISGNPTLAMAGNYLLDIQVTVKGKLYGVIPVTQQATLSDYKIKIVGPPTVNFFASKSNVCPDESITFTHTTTNYPTNYHWTFPGGTPATSSLKNPVVTYKTPGDYSVTLVVSSPAGSATKVKSSLIHVKVGPSASLLSYSTDTICGGDSMMLQAVQGNNVSYNWYKNGNPISGATNYYYYARSSGDYSIKVTQPSNGCATKSAGKNVFFVLLNASLISALNTTVCYPQTVNLAAHYNPNFTYKWYRNGSLINGANSASYLAGRTGNYKVKVQNLRGCTKNSIIIPITVNSKPTSSISTNDPTTFCAGGYATLQANVISNNPTYAWYRNFFPIPGANGLTYLATQQGSYTAKVTNRHGCTSLSNRIHVVVNCRTGGEGESNITGQALQTLISPNPTDKDAILSFDITKNSVVSIHIYDAIGKLRMSIPPVSYIAGEHEIFLNTTSFASGIYYVKMDTENENSILKLVIQ